MEFKTIQKGNIIERYYINGLRVNRSRYEHEETLINIRKGGFYCFTTEILKNGKTRNRKYSSI